MRLNQCLTLKLGSRDHHLQAADSGSVYEPHPILMYEWDPDKLTRSQLQNGHSHAATFDLGAHPADPHSTPSPSAIHASYSNGKAPQGPNAQSEQVPGHEIWVYGGNGGFVKHV